MTQDEIIEITKRSGLGMLLEVGGMDKCLEHFAKLVAAKEREDIIQIIKETPFSNWFQADVIEAIKARGEQA